MAIREMTFDDQNVRAEDDGKLYNLLFKNGVYAGIFNMFAATSAGTIVTVQTGYMNILGRQIENNANVDVITPASVGEGYIIVKIDLSQAAGSQVTLEYKQDVTLPALTQEDINAAGNIYEFPIYSYTTDGANVALTDIREYTSRRDLKKDNVELLSGTWSLINDAGDPYDGYYEYVLSDSDILPSDIATVWAAATSDVDGTFSSTGFASENYTSLGQLRLIAVNSPAGSVFINYLLERGVS